MRYVQRRREPTRKQHGRHGRHQQSQQSQLSHQSQQSRPQQQDSHCMRCGKSHSRIYTCAAAKAKCHHCWRIGHYAVVCRLKNQRKQPRVAEIQLSNQTTNQSANQPTQPRIEQVWNLQEDALFLGSVDSNNSDDKPWVTNIDINGQSCVLILEQIPSVSTTIESNRYCA